MVKRLLIAVLYLSMCNIITVLAMAGTTSENIKFPKIDRKPSPGHLGRRGVMTSVPTYDSNNTESYDPWKMDLRAYNLSKLDLSDSLNDLFYASFDDQTVWPPDECMPKGFNWQRIMELGKDPGLGIRSLHVRGITGKHVGIAIIDQTLLVDHQEYKRQLRFYEETKGITGARLRSQMHGAAVASIAVGQTTGVAPDADLYFIATSFKNSSYVVDSIHRILEINEQLPEGRKIRVISISWGWGASDSNYKALTLAAEKAKAAGVLLVCSSIERVHGLKFHALTRVPSSDPAKAESYEPEIWWAGKFYKGSRFSDRLLVPAGSSTTASPLGVSEYVFYRRGGWSWAIPYIAGVYALAVQVNPEITPEQFWSLALKTGHNITLDYHNEKIPFGPIIDPVRLIRSLEANKKKGLFSCN